MASEETAMEEGTEVEETPQPKEDGGEDQPKEPDLCLESILVNNKKCS